MLENDPIFVLGKVSVLIPCYQHGHLLPQAVESVLKQSYQNHEIIIINDGSTDNTHQVGQEYAQKYPQQIKYLYQERQGQVAARKNGSTLIRGEFLITLDADDLLAPSMMAKCAESLSKNPEAAAVASNVWMVAEDGQTILGQLDQSEVPRWPNILENNTWGGIAGIMIRSQSLQKVGWFNFDGTAGGEDWDIWIRFARARQKLLHIPDFLARYRNSYGSHSRQALRVLKGILQVLDYLTKEDPRLIQLENVHPPIDISYYNQLRNRAVFFYYGVALAAAEREETLQDILQYFVPSDLDLATLATAYIKGLIFVSQVQGNTNIFCPDFQDDATGNALSYLENKISEDQVKLLRIKIEENFITQTQSSSKNSNLFKSRIKTILIKIKQKLSHLATLNKT
ncbi:MAG: glycosyltransferase family 2 protein [Microcystis aeruginosa Ma_QC_Ca_00000000_S207]|uniref:Glycosyltransferase family 2 protein n=1 Tax=Microcystis aeruginosa Ma_QC_Ca_00000000_S207 TaxID=2486251 RepID=A0A552F8K8_MICAE|nr:MAG: glycosyltransferase family 2 protein [Microcystis aeruginosa Ma_QC_Ca_00000000_S207]